MISAISEKLPNFSLTHEQGVKVIAVAVATLLIFGASYALFTAGLTLYCESSLHAGSQDTWFNTHTFSFEDVLNGWNAVGVGKAMILVSWIALSIFGLVVLPTGSMQVKLTQIALAAPIHLLFLAVIKAPICEEILFRGFLQERLADLVFLFNRHIYPLSTEFQQKTSNLAQAILFGLAHVPGGQVAAGAELLIATLTSWTGYVVGDLKNKKKDLLSPISVHAATNFLPILFILLTARKYSNL